MTILKNTGRQEVIAAKVDFTFGTGADVAVQGAYAAVDLPEGAIVVGGFVNISDATSSSVTVALGDTGSATRYVSSINGAAVALTALVPTGYVHTVPTVLNVTIGGADPAAAGTAEVVVLYIVKGRAEFTQG